MLIKWLLKLISNKKNAPFLINYLSRIYQINLLLHTYRGMGIHVASDELSGEIKLLQLFKVLWREQKNLVLFDVGANIGQYSKWLVDFFPEAEIHAFEPSHSTFAQLEYNLRNENVRLNQCGLGKVIDTLTLYNSAEKEHSQHGTIYKEVLSELLDKGELVEEVIRIETIDHYCEENQISQIDFLKIDTEGHELDVLKGAKRMLSTSSIKHIQFEFNEMNIISRVFLKDFYELLEGYHFYRLHTDQLIKLGSYHSANEIFQFQNILASKEDNLEFI
ncbi:MAG: FkbM family methyltransferase [Cyclobacteriaceae bacterium]